MRKLTIVILSILLATNTVLAAWKPISDSARISLLTCGPGKEVFTKFGHTGIRINDPASNIDVVFHWGIFSFETPNFALRFMLGETDYEMAPFHYNVFTDEYRTRGSYILEQTIDLTPEQKHRLWAKLVGDYNSENRRYRYSFVGNNCATKAYDEIVALYGQDIGLNHKEPFTTHRRVINQYIDLYSWFSLGINIIIGSSADTPIGTQSALSFPEYTAEALSLCQHTDSANTPHPVVTEQHYLLQQTRQYSSSALEFLSQLLVPLLLIAAMIYYYHKHRRYIPVLTQLLFAIYGIIGLLILFLWFVSTHPLVDNNYNILVFTPLMLAQAVVMSLNRHKRLKTITSAAVTMSVALYIIPLTANLQGTTITLVLYWLTALCASITTLATKNNK